MDQNSKPAREPSDPKPQELGNAARRTIQRSEELIEQTKKLLQQSRELSRWLSNTRVDLSD